jgi:ribosomal protein S18 acetylase RimI-like enzyme
MASGPVPATPWEEHLGERVVVRITSMRGTADVLGDLLDCDAQTLLVRTRRGDVTVDRTTIVAGHPVPPAPSRPAPPHQALSVGDLEVVMAAHWVALEQDWLGGWLLRCSGGFTNRANSVLAVGEPGMPMDSALIEVGDWYADRGQRPIAASPEPRLGEDDTEQLLWAAGAFGAAGWAPIPGAGAVVLTAATGGLRDASPALPAGLSLDLSSAPEPAWIEQYHYKGSQGVPAVAVALLTSAPDQAFVSIRDGAAIVGVARVSAARRWAGVTAVEVGPGYRRQGLARALLGASCAWAWQQGCASVFLQVGTGNTAAQQLYRSAGFQEHHTYEYLAPPP